MSESVDFRAGHPVHGSVYYPICPRLRKLIYYTDNWRNGDED